MLEQIWHCWQLLGIEAEPGAEIKEAFFVLDPGRCRRHKATGASRSGKWSEDSATLNNGARVELTIGTKLLEFRIYPPAEITKDLSESRLQVSRREKERSEVLLVQFATDRSADVCTARFDRRFLIRQLALLMWQGPIFSDTRELAERRCRPRRSAEGEPSSSSTLSRKSVRTLHAEVVSLLELWRSFPLLQGFVLESKYSVAQQRYSRAQRYSSSRAKRLSLLLATSRSQYLSFLLDTSRQANQRTLVRLLTVVHGLKQRVAHPLKEVEDIIDAWQKAEQPILPSEQPLARQVAFVLLRNLRISSAAQLRRLALKPQRSGTEGRMSRARLHLVDWMIDVSPLAWRVFRCSAVILLLLYVGVSVDLAQLLPKDSLPEFSVRFLFSIVFIPVVFLLLAEYIFLIAGSCIKDQRGALWAMSHLFVRYDLGCIVVWTTGLSHRILEAMTVLNPWANTDPSAVPSQPRDPTLVHEWDPGYLCTNILVLFGLLFFIYALLYRQALLSNDFPCASHRGALTLAARLILASVSIGLVSDSLGRYGTQESHHFAMLLTSETTSQLTLQYVALLNHGLVAMATTVLIYAILPGLPVVENR